MKADEKLDCAGQMCPMPIVNTAKKIKNMKKGQVLEISATDEGIKNDMKAWCESTGNKLLATEEGEKIRVYVRKDA